ncbi:MAG: hypothetical protein JW816_01395 [Candidatus Buchananbacteria bacterium]|nr:hypothetical protein [Candidatus Buchananbacteria bacterium]
MIFVDQKRQKNDGEANTHEAERLSAGDEGDANRQSNRYQADFQTKQQNAQNDYYRYECYSTHDFHLKFSLYVRYLFGFQCNIILLSA